VNPFASQCEKKLSALFREGQCEGIAIPVGREETGPWDKECFVGIGREFIDVFACERGDPRKVFCKRRGKALCGQKVSNEGKEYGVIPLEHHLIRPWKVGKKKVIQERMGGNYGFAKKK